MALIGALFLFFLFVWAGYQPEAAGLFPPPLDKVAHFLLFAVLAGLLHIGMKLRYCCSVWQLVFGMNGGNWCCRAVRPHWMILCSISWVWLWECWL